MTGACAETEPAVHMRIVPAQLSAKAVWGAAAVLCRDLWRESLISRLLLLSFRRIGARHLNDLHPFNPPTSAIYQSCSPVFSVL